MRYFIDTEFIEAGYRQPLHLISLGIVSENGFEYYAEDIEAPLQLAGPWVQEHVLPHLRGPKKTRSQIAQDLKLLIPPKPDHGSGRLAIWDQPEFYGYFADYDWVIFCQIFGTMIDLPRGYPMYCMDLMQLARHLGIPRHTFPEQNEKTEHNALADARWNYSLYKFLVSQK